jgi:hypothetical protein
MAFYELRQYKVRPDKMDAWVKIMEEEIIPFQVSKGMVICGSFRGETDESVYVWLRRFESEAEREALYKAVYESDHWKTKIAPRVPDHLGPFRDGRDAHYSDREINDAVAKWISSDGSYTPFSSHRRRAGPMADMGPDPRRKTPLMATYFPVSFG